MQIVHALLTRFGLITPTSEAPDAFDLRLQRIGTRERRRQARPVLFRLQPQLMEV